MYQEHVLSEPWPEHAKLQYELIERHLNHYFAEFHQHYKSPVGMFYAIEMLLVNPDLNTLSQFSGLRGLSGVGGVKAYERNAVDYLTLSGDELWRFEGSALRRWSWARRNPYTVAEAFWAVFLHRFIGTPNKSIASDVDYLMKTSVPLDPSALFDKEYHRVYPVTGGRERIIDPYMFTTMKQIFETLNAWRSR